MPSARLFSSNRTKLELNFLSLVFFTADSRTGCNQFGHEVPIAPRVYSLTYSSLNDTIRLEVVSKVPEQNQTTSNPHERPKGRQQSFTPDFQSAIVLQPRKRALYLPSASVNQGRFPKRTALLRLLPRPALKMWNDRTDTTPFEPVPKSAAIKGFIGNHFTRTGFRSAPFLRNPYALQRFFCQRDLGRTCTCHHQTDRQAIPIRCQHDFAAFADFSVPLFTSV